MNTTTEKPKKALKHKDSHGIDTVEIKWDGWTLFAWEWRGVLRVTAEKLFKAEVKGATAWGASDVGPEEALQDAKNNIEAGKIKWRIYEIVSREPMRLKLVTTLDQSR